MKQNNKKKNTFVAENACGSHFFCNFSKKWITNITGDRKMTFLQCRI